MNPIEESTVQMQELMKALGEVQFGLNIGQILVAIVAFVFMAIGLYAIAKRRCINHPWLAWIPVANMWLLGCISDQYRYVTKGQVCSRRKRMLTAAIVEGVITLLATVLLVAWFFMIGEWVAMGTPAEGLTGMISIILILAVLVLPLLGFSIWLLVERFCAYYDLFRSCSPASKTVFTVLSIVAACLGYHILGAIFIFICRKKEEGMPPRVEG